MLQAAVNKVINEKGTFPLRISGAREDKHLVCPYEQSSDDIKVKFLNNDPRIVHFRVISKDKNGFLRHFLYSRVTSKDKKHLITASGYLFDGKVDVYSWKSQYCPSKIVDREREAITAISLVDFLHVSGDKKNKTGGLAAAIVKHENRIAGLNADTLVLEEALELYNAMRYNVPK
ncbi:MAG: hypothetical protein Q7K43_03325 [Candidatus Woesearchaeota archaeon]|nr:hypothetical protein [Candidatus Woesearchaeota archaeon]